jgi:hypothetical protein
MSDTIITTWMYSAPEDDQSLHHQVGASIGKQKIKNIYWRCCANFFRSVHLTNPQTIRYLFCNQIPPQQIDGQDFQALLKSLGVEIKVLTSITRPPKDYYGAWSTQFIVFDVLEELKKLSQPEDVVIILDSDCIFSKKIPQRFYEKVKRNKALLYTLDGAWETDNNGLTNKRLSEISQEYDPPSLKPEVFYTGGEIICLLGTEIEGVVATGRNAFDQSITRSQKGQEKFNEEAHLLSYVYGLKGYADWTANEFIRRIWTDPFISRTCYGDEIDLLIWHLPAEKKTSMKALYALGDRANGLMLDRKKLAKFLHLEKGSGFWPHFILRAMARSVIRLKRKLI